jgi:hypothetical protein
LNEPVNSSGGFYKPASRVGMNPQTGDWGATIFSAHQFAAGSTNIIRLWIPTNGGPFKLVLRCLPASKTTQEYNAGIRVRFVSFISPLAKPSFATQARWYGSVFAESQSFETTP